MDLCDIPGAEVVPVSTFWKYRKINLSDRTHIGICSKGISNSVSKVASGKTNCDCSKKMCDRDRGLHVSCLPSMDQHRKVLCTSTPIADHCCSAYSNESFYSTSTDDSEPLENGSISSCENLHRISLGDIPSTELKICNHNLSTNRKIVINDEAKILQISNGNSQSVDLHDKSLLWTPKTDIQLKMTPTTISTSRTNMQFYITTNTTKFAPSLDDHSKFPRNVISLHRAYRVYVSGGLSLPDDDIVVNDEIMNKILHESVCDVLTETSNIEMANRLQAYMWPIVSRGHSLIAVAERSRGKTLGYVLPLVTLLLDMWPCIAKEATIRVGPVVVIVCKGWHTVQCVGETLRRLVAEHGLQVLAIWGGLGKKSIAEIQKKVCCGADILVTSLPLLLRIIGAGSVDETVMDEHIQFDLLSRCFHLVIDDADVILDHQHASVKLLLTNWSTSLAKAQNSNFCQQIIITASSWTGYLTELSKFLAPHMEPAVVIASPIEAARACGVVSLAHCTNTRVSSNQALGDVVDITKHDALTKKILVFVKNNSDARQLQSLYGSVAVFTRVIHGRLIAWQINEEMRAWQSTSSGVVLIVTASTIAMLLEQDLRDVAIIVHVHIPENLMQFRQRFSFLMDNYSRDVNNIGTCPVSYVILDNNLKFLPSYLKDCLSTLQTTIPEELAVPFNESIDENVPLCHFLKAYGLCSSVNLCDYRHKMVQADIINKLPDTGIVVVEIVSVLNASRYLVRIAEYRETTNSSPIDLSGNYLKLFISIQKFCANDMVLQIVQNVTVGSLCLVNHESLWARGRVLQIQGTSSDPRFVIFLIDEGNEISLTANDLYEIPDQFRLLPQLVVEVYLCKVKPVDRDSEFTHLANIFIEQLFSKAEESAKFTGIICLSISSTIWLSPLVEIINVVGTAIKKESIRSQLIRHGFGCDNCDHVELLKKCFNDITIEGAFHDFPWISFWKSY